MCLCLGTEAAFHKYFTAINLLKPEYVNIFGYTHAERGVKKRTASDEGGTQENNEMK